MALRNDLDSLAKATRRSKGYIAQKALTEYVERNAWRARAIQEALDEAKNGEFISHEAMAAWAESLSTDRELPSPSPDVRIHDSK